MCPKCQNVLPKIVKFGRFRGSAGRLVQRFRCRSCGATFSSQTGSVSYREKKPYFDQPLFRLHSSGVSLRQCARIFGVHHVTVARKCSRLGRAAGDEVATQYARRPEAALTAVVFDEMETFEHSKCKPLSIAVAVEKDTRRIIAARVASMPAKGRLAAISRKRYGRRPDERARAIREVFRSVALERAADLTVQSDECPRYPALVRRYLPGARHERSKSRRGCVVGQGELKRGGFDPLFSLNHTCAMFRDHVKRLSRRTWCTTKRADRLQDAVDMYVRYHNQHLEKEKRPKIRGLQPSTI